MKIVNKFRTDDSMSELFNTFNNIVFPLSYYNEALFIYFSKTVGVGDLKLYDEGGN